MAVGGAHAVAHGAPEREPDGHVRADAESDATTDDGGADSDSVAHTYKLPLDEVPDKFSNTLSDQVSHPVPDELVIVVGRMRGVCTAVPRAQTSPD